MGKDLRVIGVCRPVGLLRGGAVVCRAASRDVLRPPQSLDRGASLCYEGEEGWGPGGTSIELHSRIEKK